MKRFIALAAVVFAAGLVGCSTTQSAQTSPGATGSACCAEMKGCCKADGWSGDVAPGATSDGCCAGKDKAAPGAVSAEGCAKSCTKDKAAPGAVGEGSGCCKSKAKSEAAPGAVGGEGCTKSKSSCTKDAAAPGAVSGSGCCKSKNNG